MLNIPGAVGVRYMRCTLYTSAVAAHPSPLDVKVLPASTRNVYVLDSAAI
jgi:hypothetical protein